MSNPHKFFDKTWKINLLLFVISFGIYFFYFHHVFLNINSILSSITGDSLKNYYTFLYHIKYDTGMLHFSGMNYPFGEHVVYIDCMPVITFILRLLPFTHNYLIGIFHSLIFLSFIISPLIFNRIFIKTGLDKFSAFFISLGITLLSPQLFRIYEGHYALAYACIIPYAILLLLNFLNAGTSRNLFNLFIYNTAIFIFHPYLAFGLCVFCLLGIFIFKIKSFNRQSVLQILKQLFITGILPLILFKIFMLLTDQHANRTTEPYGLNTSICTIGSLLVPVTGPFKEALKYIFKTQYGDFEGYCYLGVTMIALLFLFIITIPFTIKKLQFKKDVSALFIASVVLMLFSLGLHYKLFTWLNIKSDSLNQFRALGRFSWFFYYMLPVFIFLVIYHSLKKHVQEKTLHYISGGLALLFFASNLTEMGATVKMYATGYWKDRNVFNETCLTADEKNVIASVKANQAQAIIPLPTIYIGSEMYDRSVDYSNYPLVPSLIYSFHTGLPLVSSVLSRTSINETEEGIQILNAYKKNKTADRFMNNRPFLVIKTKTPLLPDEERIWQGTTVFQKSDSLQFGYISRSELQTPVLDKKIITITAAQVQNKDSSNVLYLPTENRKPFTFSNDGEYEFILKADSNTMSSGSYIVSLHYYYTNNTWKDVLCHLIVNKSANGSSGWQYFLPIRVLSGFYKGYGVFEYKIDLERNSSYEFIIKRGYNHFYKISDFMLRPDGTTVRLINRGDTVYNNFPAY